MILLFSLVVSPGDGAAEKSSIGPICSGDLIRSDQFWGGTNVFMKSDGYLWVQEVTITPSVRIERRYGDPEVDGARVKALNNVVKASGFAATQSATRDAMPDETVATIVLTTCDGEKRTVTQFVGDAVPAFKAVMAWFEGAAMGAKKREPLYEGKPDSSWRP